MNHRVEYISALVLVPVIETWLLPSNAITYTLTRLFSVSFHSFFRELFFGGFFKGGREEAMVKL
jgi:hypothetical protein